MRRAPVPTPAVWGADCGHLQHAYAPLRARGPLVGSCAGRSDLLTVACERPRRARAAQSRSSRAPAHDLRSAVCCALMGGPARGAQGGEARFCSKCGRHKPPRAHHCRLCRRCVLRMDHHCPWRVAPPAALPRVLLCRRAAAGSLAAVLGAHPCAGVHMRCARRAAPLDAACPLASERPARL